MNQTFKLLVLSGLLLLIMVTGCGGTPAPPTPTPVPDEIDFAISADRTDYYDPLIEAFHEQHPEIKINRRTFRSENTWQFLLKENKVDMFEFAAGNDMFQQLYDKERLLGLSAMIQASEDLDLDDYYADALAPYSVEGEIWALPGEIDLGVVFYNKDLFDQFGVPYPTFEWTWDDLVFKAQQIRDVEENVYGFATQSFFAIPFIYQHGGQIVDDWQTPTRTTFDDPLAIQAVKWYAGLAHDYEVMGTPVQLQEAFGDNRYAGYLFWRKKIGIYMDFLSNRGGISWGQGARWDMNWGVVPLPQDAQAATLGYATAYAIVKDTEYPNVCWDWLLFLSEQAPAYAMPARKSIAKSDEWADKIDPQVVDVALDSIDHALIFGPAHAEYNPAIGGFIETVEAVLNGNVDAEMAMKDLQMQMETQ